MSDSQPVVELRMPSRSFRWDTGLFFVVFLGIVVLGFFLVDIQSEPIGELEELKQEAHVLFTWLNGALTLGALGMWIHMNYVLNRSMLRIENGRITGTTYNGDAHQVNLDLSEIDGIEVERSRDGRAVSLSLEHKAGTIKLYGFPDLDALLNVICDLRQELAIRDSGPKSVWSFALPAFAAFAALLTITAMIYARYHPFESISPFLMLLVAVGTVRLALFQIVWESKRRGPKYQGTIRLLYAKIFVFALLSFAVCVVLSGI